MLWVRCVRRGFTLIELMIVISIIGLLSSIAVPIGLNSRDKTMRLACKKNLAHINHRIDLYSLEHDEAPVDWQEDLKIYFSHGHIPDCPGKGSYVVERPGMNGKGIGELSCTYHGFYYDDSPQN